MSSKAKSVTPVDKHVGRKLKERRLELGISQDELAKNIGITFQQLQKYETGNNRVSCSKLHGIFSQLKVDANYFFEGLGNNKNNDTWGEVNISCQGNIPKASKEELEQLCEFFSFIDSFESRKHILGLVKSISSNPKYELNCKLDMDYL